jgi:hypothetical protein
MIFIITHGSDVTADFQCVRLARDGVPFVRIDSDTVTARVKVRATEEEATVEVDGHRYSLADVSCVWLRRPKPIEVAAIDGGERTHASTEWGEALEGFLTQLPERIWINHPSRNARASHKIEQLTSARRVGLRVPPTLVTQEADEAKAFLESHAGRIIAKPLYAGYIERTAPEDDTSIYTSRVEPSHLERRDLLRRCPTLFQGEIDKLFDVRVCYVDGRLRCVRMDREDTEGRQVLDIRRDNMVGVRYTAIEPPDDVAAALKNLLGHYRLRFAAVDFAVAADGAWVFFEINPNGQWAWLDLAGATDIAGDLLWAMQR